MPQCHDWNIPRRRLSFYISSPLPAFFFCTHSYDYTDRANYRCCQSKTFAHNTYVGRDVAQVEKRGWCQMCVVCQEKIFMNASARDQMFVMSIRWNVITFLCRWFCDVFAASWCCQAEWMYEWNRGNFGVMVSVSFFLLSSLLHATHCICSVWTEDVSKVIEE